MSDASASAPKRPEPIDLDKFRDYLYVLARGQIGQRVQSKLDASDIVQQTLVTAIKQRESFRGQNEAEMAGWLRAILASTLNLALLSLNRDKRDVHRERSLQDAIDQSSIKLQGLLAADQSTPSQQVRHQEDVLAVAKALAHLSDKQREAIWLHHCEGLSVVAVARHMGCSAPSVVNLLKRGRRRLQEIMSGEPSPEAEED